MSWEILDLRDLANEWRQHIEDTEDDAYSDMDDKFDRLCDELGIDHTPTDLEAYGNNYEPALIHEDYFTQYAQDLAEDIGAIGTDLQWPAYCIDWERAATDLKADYTTVEYDGDTYYIRSC